jgi:hypothetical protein
MNTQKENLVLKIVKAGAGNIIEHERRAIRSEVVSELEACLVDSDRLDMYLEALRRVAGDRVCEGTLTEERENLVLERGLSALTDGELVHLALNPDALVTLYDQVVHDSVTDHWGTRFAEAAEARIADMGDEGRALVSRMDAFMHRYYQEVESQSADPSSAEA